MEGLLYAKHSNDLLLSIVASYSRVFLVVLIEVVHFLAGTLQVWCIALDQWNAEKSSDALEGPWRTD